jgi:hypothetical protein
VSHSVLKVEPWHSKQCAVTVTVTVTDCLLNTSHVSYRKVHTLSPSCPGYARTRAVLRAPLHEVLSQPSPPLHVLESGGIPACRIWFPNKRTSKVCVHSHCKERLIISLVFAFGRIDPGTVTETPFGLTTVTVRWHEKVFAFGLTTTSSSRHDVCQRIDNRRM